MIDYIAFQTTENPEKILKSGAGDKEMTTNDDISAPNSGVKRFISTG
jgi:hypothetical protein|tara:strand:+ start:367 stop:507 length:141 start_codon:yes stop_codon:yes gene_type:complete